MVEYRAITYAPSSSPLLVRNRPISTINFNLERTENVSADLQFLIPLLLILIFMGLGD